MGNAESWGPRGICSTKCLREAWFIGIRLLLGGYNVPRRVREVIAHLACRLSRWDYRLFRKSIFGAADEIELKFMNRRNHEDVNLFSIILNQEIRKLSRQVIRVKWSLHAREEIIFKLVQHLRENVARQLLEGLRKNTREMLEEQEAVCGRLFTIQDVMQSSVRAWLQSEGELVEAVDIDLRKMLIKPSSTDPLVLGVRVWPQAISSVSDRSH